MPETKAQTPEIKAVIFDLGGVVVRNPNLRILREAGRVFGKRIRVKKSLGFLYSRFNARLETLQRGDIDELTFLRDALGIQDRLRGDAQRAIDVFEKPFKEHFQANWDTLALIDELRSNGYRVVALTNTIQSHLAITKKEIGQHFDAIAASCSEGFSKPQKELYLIAAQRAGCAPENCLAFDDIMRYVKGARAAGLQAALFKSVAQARSALVKHGVRVSPKPKRKRKIPCHKERLPPMRKPGLRG